MKLVRDKVPDIIRAEGADPVVHNADQEELGEALRAKLQEEVDEYLATPCEEEVADIIEVLFGLCKHNGFNWDEVLEIRERKREERGGYADGVILENIKKDE